MKSNVFFGSIHINVLFKQRGEEMEIIREYFENGKCLVRPKKPTSILGDFNELALAIKEEFPELWDVNLKIVHCVDDKSIHFFGLEFICPVKEKPPGYEFRLKAYKNVY